MRTGLGPSRAIDSTLLLTAFIAWTGSEVCCQARLTRASHRLGACASGKATRPHSSSRGLLSADGSNYTCGAQTRLGQQPGRVPLRSPDIWAHPTRLPPLCHPPPPPAPTPVRPWAARPRAHVCRERRSRCKRWLRSRHRLLRRGHGCRFHLARIRRDHDHRTCQFRLTRNRGRMPFCSGLGGEERAPADRASAIIGLASLVPPQQTVTVVYVRARKHHATTRCTETARGRVGWERRGDQLRGRLS